VIFFHGTAAGLKLNSNF